MRVDFVKGKAMYLLSWNHFYLVKVLFIPGQSIVTNLCDETCDLPSCHFVDTPTKEFLAHYTTHLRSVLVITFGDVLVSKKPHSNSKGQVSTTATNSEFGSTRDLETVKGGVNREVFEIFHTS